jgi:hypothetical protein
MYINLVSLTAKMPSLKAKDSRFVMDVDDSSKLFFADNISHKRAWEAANLYTYDLVRPRFDESDLFTEAIRDLNRYTGFTGRIEKRMMRCYIITNADTPLKQAVQKDPVKKTEGADVYTGMDISLGGLASFLNSQLSLNYPVVTRVNSDIPVKIIFDSKKTGLNDIKKQLRVFGFDVVEGEAEAQVFILSDKEPVVSNQ